jgi:hypothetical protein
MLRLYPREAADGRFTFVPVLCRVDAANAQFCEGIGQGRNGMRGVAMVGAILVAAACASSVGADPRIPKPELRRQSAIQVKHSSPVPLGMREASAVAEKLPAPLAAEQAPVRVRIADRCGTSNYFCNPPTPYCCGTPGKYYCAKDASGCTQKQ